MSKLTYILIACGMLFTFSGCVSAYNSSLTAAKKRADYVNNKDVHYYKDLDPNRPTKPVVAPNKPNNGVMPAPTYNNTKPGTASPAPAPNYNNNAPKPAGNNAQPGPNPQQPGPNANPQQPAQNKVCTRDAECPGTQKCKDINKNTKKGVCK